MFVTLAIVCICFFILSFSLLFWKKLGKFFNSILKFFNKLFRIKKKKKERLKASKSQIVPKLITANKSVDALKEDPKQEKTVIVGEKNIENPFVKISEELPLRKIVEDEKFEEKMKLPEKKFSLSLEETQRNKLMAKERLELDEELEKLTKNFYIDEKKSEDKVSMFEKKKHLPNFILNRTQEDEKAILSKRKMSNFTDFAENKNSTEIVIDNEKIDLGKLPTNIKKLLISGILDRKDF
ncbi:MAG: hypothetical protein EOM55_01095 [Clostridia bacterium]|nr:hypothetical protein [Clostridia bacterium]